MTAASRELSEEINTLADALAEHIETERIVLGGDADFRELVLDYCPRTLSRDFAERIFSSIPEPHLVRLAAHALAARLVYDWGIGLAGRVADVSGAGELGRAYLAMAREAAELVQAVGRSRLAERERLLDILTNEGPRRLTLRRLGLE
jgi:glutamate dehydrogenase